MPYIFAWKSGNKEITYRDESGTLYVKRGGTRSWRNNNPGNIKSGDFSESNGEIGDDGMMAIFPDEAIGRSAVKALITGKKYKNLSIKDAIYRYAPPSDNNDTDAYVAVIVKATGAPSSTIIKDLSVAQLDAFVGAIKKHEGWEAGETSHTKEQASGSLGGGQDPRISRLVEIGTSAKTCEAIRLAARKAMIPIYGKVTAKNACAATLTLFLKEAGFGVSGVIYGAGKLARFIENDLGWRRIKVGAQQPGDVGVCYDHSSPAGSDHVFFVTERVDDDEMMIVDNQESLAPHRRFASGFGGKTPVEYFLTARSERSAVPRYIISGGDREKVEVDTAVVTEDQDTNDLVIRFNMDGTLIE